MQFIQRAVLILRCEIAMRPLLAGIYDEREGHGDERFPESKSDTVSD
jgi:hypothetical protein